jgi:exodeoxyribonuclease VII small subunit
MAGLGPPWTTRRARTALLGRIVTVADTSKTPVQKSAAQKIAVPNADVAELSYEQARDDLVRVVSELEQGSSTLEQSLALWERGEALAQRCEEWLVGARARLDAARSASTAS